MFDFSKKALTKIKEAMDTLTEEELMLLIENEEDYINQLNKMIEEIDNLLKINFALIDALLFLRNKDWFNDLCKDRGRILS